VKRPIIYHGTPMTPRAARLNVLAGRAACVPFPRRDHVKDVEAVCPRIMFRQRRLYLLARGGEKRRGVGRDRARLDALLSLARTASEKWAMGSDPRSARRTITAQRRFDNGMAFRTVLWGSPLAHGRPAAAPCLSCRAVRYGGARLDGGSETRAGRLRGLSRAHEGGRGAIRRSVAANPHDARRCRRSPISIHERRQHVPSAERSSL
jgi:hypothetical protein